MKSCRAMKSSETNDEDNDETECENDSDGHSDQSENQNHEDEMNEDDSLTGVTDETPTPPQDDNARYILAYLDFDMVHFNSMRTMCHLQF